MFDGRRVGLLPPLAPPPLSPFLGVAAAVASASALMASTSRRRLRSSGLSDTGTVIVPPYSTGRNCTAGGRVCVCGCYQPV